ncbi:DUF445 family protein [Halobacillus sp. BAB-2008]|uniref:DUF445 domain-containing protein n=1 Tax=Halobacillus sp. BAB-2008 TaxID=1246484 RepID=UPI0002A4F50A|nr:DUF445 family protein [Halobacillus sp. BAB-2008]ELK47645.1 hypothetical protein D479_06085 [Halobacillus sp. BAB-2008]
MNPVLLIIMMVAIGALIGGLTNSLAIKMLFRPYRAVYIGKFRLPFTPGLIPKRQKELAQQLGKMVVNHLLTAEGLRRKLEHPKFQEQMTAFAGREVQKLLQQDKPLRDLLNKYHVDVSTAKLEQQIEAWVEERYDLVMERYRTVPLKEVLKEQWLEQADESIEALAGHLQASVEQYFRSGEGREKVEALIENYMDNQGFLGSMISSFIGPEGLTERIYPLILKYVSDREMNDWLQSMLRKEKDKLLEQPVGFFEDKVGSRTISKTLGRAASNALPVEEWMNRTVQEWTAPYQKKIVEEFVPVVVQKSIVLLSSKIEGLMSTMKLADIVQEEVEAFQVDRLEEMVLGISRREFKMITYLGALLGGLIGILQGLIVLLMG